MTQGRRNQIALAMIVALACLLAAIAYLSVVNTRTSTWSYSRLMDQALQGRVKTFEIDGDVGIATDRDGRQYAVQLPANPSTLASTLASDGVEVAFADSQAVAALQRVLPYLLVVPVMGLLIFFVFRQVRGPSNQPLMFVRSPAKLVVATPEVAFVDVAGADEAKQELAEIVEFLKDPARFAELGARIPKGVLLAGPPGTGKTLLSKAVAGEAGVPFFSASGSEFVELFVGVGAGRVRDLFVQAKKTSPCIVFVDEIDAVGRQRRVGFGGAHDEREQTLNQLLVEMDGFDTNTHVIVIAATNRPDVLDPALLRPGRFDRHVRLDLPEVRGRREILDVHARNKPLEAAVDLDVLARQTPGFSGADLANLINEAAILAARANRKVIGMEEMEEAIARVIAGPEKKSRRISEREKEVIAYHEVGHALVMKALPLCDPVHKVSVVSRGMALGWTLTLPGEDRYLVSKEELKQQIAGIMGGRAAEEIVFGDVTSGAENDIQRATQMARRMVMRWGMGERVGIVLVGHGDEHDVSGSPVCSDEMAARIDQEVTAIVEQAYQLALSVLGERRQTVDSIAERLLEVETMGAEELDALVSEAEGEDSERPAAG
ncbi:MAG TPA: ATP-dependent zinc metalloprotease FtsH [Candidatus Dormibacteraeota bacterium]|nr:ATP-dependent zinc metalloprotease FtsH [Candidatus Dormibacteraeota bacterium]